MDVLTRVFQGQQLMLTETAKCEECGRTYGVLKPR
jgi:hypothetical protein